MYEAGTLMKSDGTIRHDSGDFFYVQGVRVSMTEEREVGDGGWDQTINNAGRLRWRDSWNPQDPKFNDIPYYLVEG